MVIFFMVTCEKGRQSELTRLLKHGTDVLGLKLCFRDNTLGSGLPDLWWFHVVPACMENKRRQGRICQAFAQGKSNQAAMAHPKGLIQECPFGFSELVVPVFVSGDFVGPLFAGPCWLKPSPPPHPSLVCPPSLGWLKARLDVLRTLALQIGKLLEESPSGLHENRRRVVLDYIKSRIHGQPSIHGLAKMLNLSPSRTTHLVRELFNTSLPLLARRIKLRQAAQSLLLTDLTIGELAARFGFEDQNYFSRVFSRAFGLSPRAYRKQHPAGA